jgi:DNA-binding XRE family transcriptional regulator
MTYSTYYRLENGIVRGDPSAKTAQTVAKVLSVDAAAVLRAVEQSRICRAVAAAPVVK